MLRLVLGLPLENAAGHHPEFTRESHLSCLFFPCLSCFLWWWLLDEALENWSAKDREMQSPMSMKCLLKRLPFQMGIWRKGPFATERFTHQFEAAGMFTDWTSCSPLFFFALRSYFVCFFRGVVAGKSYIKLTKSSTRLCCRRNWSFPEGAEGASWRVKLQWTSW